MTGRSETRGLPLSMVQRIEVIRGPGSALYGADAFAGVINILTKTAADTLGTEIGARLGSFERREGWLNHGGEYGPLDVALLLAWNRGDGHEGWVVEDAQSQFDQRFGTNASRAPGSLNAEHDWLHAHLNVGWGKHWRGRATARRSRGMGTGLGFGQALDPDGSADTEVYGLDVEYRDASFSPDWEVSARLDYHDFDTLGVYTLYPPGAFGGYFPTGFLWDAGLNGDQLRAEGGVLYRGWRGHTTRIGAGWHQSRLTDVIERRNWGVDPASGQPYPLGEMTTIGPDQGRYLPTANRRNRFVYLQDTWSLAPQWELTAGIRFDDFSDFGSTTNPRLALVWKTTANLTGKLLYGSAFRAPTLAELGFRNPLLGLGDPGLAAETVDTWELVWEWRARPDLHLALNLFHYQIEDKIGFPGGQIQYANYGEWDGQGMEFEARWKFFPRAALLFNVAFQDNEDETGHAVADALQQSAFLRLDWMFARHWFLDVNTRWIAGRPRAVNDTRADLADYHVTDLTIRRKHPNQPRNFALGIRNVLDRDAREPTTVNIGVTHDLPLPGREWFVEARYRF